MNTLASVTWEKNEKSVYRIFVVKVNEDDETKKKNDNTCPITSLNNDKSLFLKTLKQRVW